MQLTVDAESQTKFYPTWLLPYSLASLLRALHSSIHPYIHTSSSPRPPISPFYNLSDFVTFGVRFMFLFQVLYPNYI